MLGLKRLVVETRWCKGCGICAAFCPGQVLEIENGKVHVKAMERCELRCPDYALYLVNVEE